MPLCGRGDELEALDGFLDRAAQQGDAILLSGDAGVGKSALLETAAERAVASGFRLMRTDGTEFEAEIAYSALNRAVVPMWSCAAAMPEAQRATLEAALGLGPGEPTSRLAVTNAFLGLLRTATIDRPLLLVFDDLHWLDRASAEVLGLAARRLNGMRVGLLAAARRTDGGSGHGGLPTLEVLPLDSDASQALLTTHFPSLAPAVQRRLLAEARGNPLALVELPAALNPAQRQAEAIIPSVLPLTRRLETIFSAQVVRLPEITRHLLLMAALEGDAGAEVLAAALGVSSLAGPLVPAEDARLAGLTPDHRRVMFRHPLVRAAVVGSAGPQATRSAHQALSAVLEHLPERRAWHLAEAAVGPAESIAAQLEQAAVSMLSRGDVVGAIRAMTRAADVSPDGSGRARRLGAAAFVGANVTGDLRSVAQLLADARAADPTADGTVVSAMAASTLLLNGDGDVDSAHRLLLAAMEADPGLVHSNRALFSEALWTLGTICWFGGRAELWEPLKVFINRYRDCLDEFETVAGEVYADPANASPAGLALIDSAIEGLRSEQSPARIIRIANAATSADRGAVLREALWRVVEDGRNGGAVVSAIVAMVHLCADSFSTGRWSDAVALADEGLALADRHGHQLFSWPLHSCKAGIAAMRGDADGVQAETSLMMEWAVPRRARQVQHLAAHARIIESLGASQFENAYQHAVSVSPAGKFLPFVPQALRVAFNLVEAAVHTNRIDEAKAHMAAIERSGMAGMSSKLSLQATGAAALVAPPEQAAELFDAALSAPESEEWPFDRARVQLLYGEQLRRAGEMALARTQLNAAHETFTLLGAELWAKRAEIERRATGGHRTHSPDLAVPLTPQEREVAELAASGLTNRQIAAQLYLSPRTVGNHLHRTFPKLGITARAGLRDALTAWDTGQCPDE
jgi:DNA-binding CsgD family transcriptional regulator